MFERSILFPSVPSVSLTEILIVLAIASLAYFVVFNNFEKHVPLHQRLAKLAILVGILAIIGLLFGRVAFWGIIGLMTLGQVYLHGIYFPKQGINGLTAEPYDKYLKVIKKMKGNN